MDRLRSRETILIVQDVEGHAGDAQPLCLLLASAATLRDEIGAALAPRGQSLHVEALTELRGRLGETTFSKVWRAAQQRIHEELKSSAFVGASSYPA